MFGLFRKRSRATLARFVAAPTIPTSEGEFIGDASLEQAWHSVRPREEMARGLLALQPEVPWCHWFRLADDLVTVTREQERYYGKAKGLKIMARQLIEAIPYITRRGDVRQLTVLDLACAEGAHAIELAAAGARRVLGIEGRQLYVDRARFIAECFGLTNVGFMTGDVRRVAADATGTFDLVLFYGILHHLAAEDFGPMLARLRSLCADTTIVYTHTSDVANTSKFAERLSDMLTTPDGYQGRQYREHPDNASEEQKRQRVRSSLDNTFSFWPTEAALLEGLRRAGFAHVSRQLHPNPFARAADEYRVFYVCRV